MTIITKTIMKSNNIIIKTLNQNSADDLIKYQHIWEGQRRGVSVRGAGYEPINLIN